MADDTPSTDCTHPYQESALEALRRHVTLSIRDLAVAVVTDAEELEPGQVPPDRLEEIERSLERRHVPELEERSYVRYDEHRDLVSLLGRGADASVDIAADGSHTVDLETPDPKTASVDLDERTLQCLHEAMRQEENLDPEMSYDEVIRRLAGD